MYFHCRISSTNYYASIPKLAVSRATLPSQPQPPNTHRKFSVLPICNLLWHIGENSCLTGNKVWIHYLNLGFTIYLGRHSKNQSSRLTLKTRWFIILMFYVANQWYCMTIFRRHKAILFINQVMPKSKYWLLICCIPWQDL